MLRGIPNLVTLRPADAAETVEAWKVAITRTAGPTALILTRQKLPALTRATDAVTETARGGYIVHEPATAARAESIAAAITPPPSTPRAQICGPPWRGGTNRASAA